MKTKSKSLKNIIVGVVFSLIIIMTGVLLASCGGDKAVTDVTKLEGIVDKVGTSIIQETGELSGITITFVKDSSEFKASYNDAEITLEKTKINDYYGDGSNVTAYQYSYTFELPIAVETFNASPISIECKIDETLYRFTLTTDLIERIYPDLAE